MAQTINTTNIAFIEKHDFNVVTTELSPVSTTDTNKTESDNSSHTGMCIATSKENRPQNIEGDGPRIVHIRDYKAAALTLAEAFSKDHVAWYFLDTPDREQWTKEEKWALHVKIFEYIVYAHCLKGLVLSSGPNHDCIALWMPPGKNMDDMLTIVRSGMWRLKYKLSAEGRARFFEEFLPLLNTTKAEILGNQDDKSWYLVYLGTKADARGKGYARKVIEYVTQKADAENRMCYVESSELVNRIIYGKMGFAMKKKIWLKRGQEDILLDIMTREPGAERVVNTSA